MSREQQNLEFLVARALAEDLGQAGDITSEATIPADARGAARLVARSPGVLAGLPAVELLSRKFELDSRLAARPGRRRPSRRAVAWSGAWPGPMRSLLAMERTALNFLQRLSGIATLTARYVAAVARHSRGDLRHTQRRRPAGVFSRSTRSGAAAAVNHRFGLHDAVLIKDNHLAWIKEAAGPAARIRSRPRSRPREDPRSPGTTIEIEVDSLEQFDSALDAAPDIILVDNLGRSKSPRPSAGVTPPRRSSSSRPPAA